MNRHLVRLIAAMLVPAMIGADPSWAADLAGAAHATKLSIKPLLPLWSQQALSQPLVDGFGGRDTSYRLRREEGKRLGIARTTRREWIQQAALFVVALFSARRSAAGLTPSLDEARRYKNLLPRLIDTSPSLQASLEKIRAARDHLDATAARNEAVSVTQNDLTHSPRIPLGSSAQTPGPLKPAIEDVIARADLEIQGPRQKVESLHRKRSGFWSNLANGFQTMFFHGGWQFNSDSIIVKSWQDYYEAAIEVPAADNEAFKIVESEWLELQAAWFDMNLIDVEIRRLETEKRYLQKRMAANKQVIEIRANPALDTENQNLQDQIRGIDQDIHSQILKQETLASLTVIKNLKGKTGPDRTVSAAAHDYRPLPPQAQPTLEFVENILLRTDQRFDRGAVRAFRSALKNRLDLEETPGDPWDPRTRALVLDRVWKVDKFDVSIPAPNIERDTEFSPSMDGADVYLSIPRENLLTQAKASPEQAAIGFGIQRLWESIDTLFANELREWRIRIYGQLGLALPVQVASYYKQQVKNDQTEKLKDEREDLIAAAQRMLDEAADTNDVDVAQARDQLQGARTALVQAAQDSIACLKDTTNDIATTRLREYAYQFEKQIFVMEQKTLLMEKAYQRLHYFMEGRTELRRLLDEKRDAYLAAKSAPPQTTPPSLIERKDLSLPDTTQKQPKSRANLSRPTKIAWLGLGTALVAAADPLVGPLFQPASVPDFIQWTLVGVLVLWTLIFPHLPHLLNGRAPGKHESTGIWLLGFAAVIAALFPVNSLWGLGVGGVTAWAAWVERPRTITRHVPYSLPYWGAFTLDRRKFVSAMTRMTGVLTVITYFLFPIFEVVRSEIEEVVRSVSSGASTVQAVSITPIRIPLTYTPPESGELVRVKAPEGDEGTFTANYLVRWIGPNDPIPDDAVFVFRSRSGTEALEDQIVREQADVRTAQGRAETARAQGNQSALQTAQAAISEAQSRLAAAKSKLSARAEPMPSGITLQVDPGFPMAAERTTSVAAGMPLVLAYQKTSFSAEFPLIMSPEQAAALGKGLAEPQRQMRMQLTPKDGGRPLLIPVQAIQQLDRSTDEASSLSALSRDPAKGGFAQFRLDAAVLITDDLRKVPGLVPQETLDFLKAFNSNKSGSLFNLDLTGFEERKGNRWVPYREVLGRGEVIGLAELQTTHAPAPRASAPQETAVYDVSSIQKQLAAEQASEVGLQNQLTRLPQGDPSSEEPARMIMADIAAARARIQNLEDQLRHTRPTVQMMAEQGTTIGAGQLETVENGRWVVARRRWARLVNVWTQRNPSRGTVSMPAQNGVMLWDPQDLVQVREGDARIVVQSSLKNSQQIGLAQWEVEFPGLNKTVIYDKSLASTTNDPVNDLSRITITKAFSIAEARQLIPRPGSVLPVKLHLPPDTITSSPIMTQPSRPFDWRKNWKSIATPAGVLLSYIGVRVVRWRSERKSAATVAIIEARDTDYLPSYIPEKPLPLPETPMRVVLSKRNLESMDSRSIDTLAGDLRMSYFTYEHRDTLGRELNEDDIEMIQFGHTGLQSAEAKTYMKYFYFLKKKDDPNTKIWQSLWILVVESALYVAMFLSDRAFGQLRTAFLAGTPVWEILRNLIISKDWSGVFTIHTLLTSPISFLEFTPFFVLTTLVWLLFYQVSKNLIERIGGLWSRGRLFWFKRFKKIDVIRRNFLKTTAEISRRGTGLRPMEAVQHIRKDADGYDDLARSQELHEPDKFMELLRRYSQMLTLRASENLRLSSEHYLNEKPEELDALRDENPGTLEAPDVFDTKGRRDASDARWWATILRETARYQGTPRGLIPPGTPLDQDHIQFEPDWLEKIATRIYHMDVTEIRKQLNVRLHTPHSVGNLGETEEEFLDRLEKERQAEIERRFNRIHAEYMDRALVHWAVEEMTHRPISSFMAMETYDLVGLAMRGTGDKANDRRFRERRGEIEAVLDEFRLRLPTLSKRAHKRKSEYSRQTRMFQMINYLSRGFSENDRLNPTLQRTVERLMIDPRTGRSIIRERSEFGVPTFEALAFRYYVTGKWPDDMAAEVQRALEARRGFDASKAADTVAKIRSTLDRKNTRLYMAWLVARRMLKDMPDNFDELLLALRYTPNRHVYDLRFLSDPAPIMDIKKENHATNADLLMANLTHEDLFEELMDTTGKPILGDIDFFEDPALEINLREAAIDLGVMSRAVGGRVQLSSLSEALDPFIDELSERVTSRLPGPENRRIHVLTKKQTDQLLPKAGQHMENSVFQVAVEPGNLTRVVDPDVTDDNLYIIAPPSPYLKFAALLIYFYRVSLDTPVLFDQMTHAQQEHFKERLEEIEGYLERMNVRVRICKEWNEDILERDAPSDEDDHSYNTILIIFPGARRLKSTPSVNEPFPQKPGDATLEETPELSMDAARMLARTRWGEGGKGAIYRVLDGVVIPRLAKGFYLLRDRWGRLLALRYYHEHTIKMGAVDVPAIYHSWTTSVGSMRRRGMVREISIRTLGEFKKKLKEKGIAYCNVEADNERSWKNLEKRDYLQVGEFVTGLMSNLHPESSPHMRPAKAADKQRVLGLLENTYHDYLFTDFDPVSFDVTDGHYVWEENGQILAVINAKRQHWEIERLKFKGDWPLIWLFKKVRGLKKIFNLGDFYFLKLGNVAYASGQADKAVRIVEAVMADKKVNDALGYFDKKSPIYHDLRKAKAFGPTGTLNMVQETKIRVYAYAFDPENRKLITELNQQLKENNRTPAFYAYRNLLWWLAPFAGLMFSLFGIPSPTSAATTAALASISQAPAIQHAASMAMQVAAPAGSSPWWFAEHFPGTGSHVQRVQELIAANPQWAEAAKMAKKAGAKLTEDFLFHPGDLVNIPGNAVQSAVKYIDMPSIKMTETPFSGLIHVLVHPVEIFYFAGEIALIVLLMGLGVGIGIWLWKYAKKRLRLFQPVLGGALAVAELAAQHAQPVTNKPPAVNAPKRSGTPAQRRAPARAKAKTETKKEQKPTPVTVPPAKPAIEPILVPDVVEAPAPPVWLLDKEARVAGVPASETTALNTQLNQPPAPLPISKKDKRATQTWITYANARIQDAKAAQDALLNGPATEAQRRIAQIDASVLKKLAALLGEWKAAASSLDLSQTDQETLDNLSKAIAQQEREAGENLDKTTGEVPSSIPEVEQLRMEYLALYAQRKAEGTSDKPLITATVNAQKPAKQGIWQRFLTPLKLLAHPAQSLGIKAAKPLGIFPDSDPVRTWDPPLETLRERTEDLIRAAKRNQTLAHALLTKAEEVAKEMPEPSAEKPQETEARLEWLRATFEHVQAIRQVDASRAAAEAADQWADRVRDGLSEAQDIPNLPEPDRFENVFKTSVLWDNVPAGPSQLADDLVEVEARAVKGVLPVNGTEKMKGRERHETLDKALSHEQDLALTQAVQVSVAKADMDEQLALGQHLRYLGLQKEAVQVEDQALLLAREWNLLPTGAPLYRATQRVFHTAAIVALQDQDPALASVLNPILEKAQTAESSWQATADKAITLERDWYWKAKLAESWGLDAPRLFPEDRGALTQTLQNEAKARAAIKAAETALTAAAAERPNLLPLIPSIPLPEVKPSPLNDHALEVVERDMVARNHTLQLLGTVSGRHAKLLNAFWQELPWPVEEWKDFAALVQEALGSVPSPKNTRAAKLGNWLTMATWVKNQILERKLTPEMAIQNKVSLISAATISTSNAPKPAPKAFRPPPPRPVILTAIPPKLEMAPFTNSLENLVKIPALILSAPMRTVVAAVEPAKPTNPEASQRVNLLELNKKRAAENPDPAAALQEISPWFKPQDNMEAWFNERYGGVHFGYPTEMDRPVHRVIMSRTITLLGKVEGVTPETLKARADFQLEAFKLAWRLQQYYAGHIPELLAELDGLLITAPSMATHLTHEDTAKAIEDAVHKRLLLPAASTGQPHTQGLLTRAA